MRHPARPAATTKKGLMPDRPGARRPPILRNENGGPKAPHHAHLQSDHARRQSGGAQSSDHFTKAPASALSIKAMVSCTP